MGERPSVAEIEEVIRRYLRVHPHAVDTERGIREWWMHGAPHRYAASDVRAAIQRLVAAGELVERLLPGGQCIYASAGSTPSDTA
jgi:acetate kinase